MDRKNLISLVQCIVGQMSDYLLRIKPFSIYGYGLVSRKSSVLIFGGHCNGFHHALIAKYTLDKWEHIGNLQAQRAGHRAIANENRMYVIGGGAGSGSKSTEIYDEFTSVFDDYTSVKVTVLVDAHLPALFLVNSDFCVTK